MESLNIQLDIKVNKSIDKKDRWERHFHAALFEALIADPRVIMGDEVDLFSMKSHKVNGKLFPAFR